MGEMMMIIIIMVMMVMMMMVVVVVMCLWDCPDMDAHAVDVEC
jgi:hypothetical protein